MMKIAVVSAIVFALPLLLGTAYGAEAAADSLVGEVGSRTFAAAIAFGLAVISAGFGIARAGSAGLAASAERPEIRTIAIIISAFAEALAIYGIVIAFFILAA
ncbi:ATP synthase subunit c [archaeon HR01]|nr:ATP synthase subunit c [archaeon HR01]